MHSLIFKSNKVRSAVITALVGLSSVSVAFAEVTTPVSINLEEQPLKDALDKVSETFDVTVIAPGQILRNKRAPAINRKVTTDEVVEILLQNSGLEARRTNSGAILVIPQESKKRTIEQSESSASNSGYESINQEVEVIEVVGSAIGDLSRAFAGGQVATGQQLGLLGNRDRLETPVSTTSLTSEYLENTQTIRLNDALQSFTSVQATTTPNQGNGGGFQIRGIQSGLRSVAFAGLGNVFYEALPSTVGIERVELIRGPSTLFTGLSSAFSNGVGGFVNLIPKRGAAQGEGSFSVGYKSDSVGYTRLEYGSRSGDADEWGYYLGGEFLSGETQVDSNEREEKQFAASLDYNGEDFRALANFIYTNTQVDGQSREIFGAIGPTLPVDFNTSNNFNQPWAFINAESLISIVRLEYDITSTTNAYGIISHSVHDWEALSAFQSALQPNGDFTSDVGIFDTDDIKRTNVETGVRSQFQIGEVSHNFVIAFTYGEQSEKFDFVGFDPADQFTNNIFNPISSPIPAIESAAPPNNTSENTFFGATVANTFGFFDDRLQLTTGLRYQDIETESFDGTTGVRTDIAEGDKWSPGIAILYKVTEDISVYANYLEALSNGGQAPDFAVNAGAQLGPVASESYEIGTKLNVGDIGFDIALFQYNEAQTDTDPVTGIFAKNGERRTRGLELTAFGEVMPNLRIITGASIFDSEITESTNNATIGESRAGLPDYRLFANIEYDVPTLKQLTFTGRIRHQAEARVIQGNDLDMPDWTTVDLGLRYAFTDSTRFLLNVENV
ncbi:MAG: TonB-dependent receptor, partial [Pseudomonadota bacterium]